MSANTTLLTFAVAIYIGSALKDFFTILINNLVMPLLAATIGSEKSIDKIVWTVGGIKLNVGDVISALINLFLAYLIVSLTLPYIQAYAPPSFTTGGRR